MGFVGSLLGGSSGSGFQAQSDPNNIQNLQAQQGITADVEQNLRNLIAGQGPNPVLEQLKQQTAQNNQQNAGFIASQKGISPGMAVRLAGQNAAAANQHAIGQGAQLQAQQQLGAIGQLGQTSLGQQNAIQANINSANSANAGIANTNAQSQGNLLGGAIGGLGSAAMLLAHGGEVPAPVHHYADGGAVAPQSFAGNFLNMGQRPAASAVNPMASGMAGFIGGLAHLVGGGAQAPAAAPLPGSSAADYQNMNTGNSAADYQMLEDAGAPAPQFTSGQVLAAPQMAMPAQNIMPGAMVAAQGGKVPGKAAVPGDSLKNDKVPAVLSPGEIVIPRSILQSANPALAAAHFVEQELAKHGKKKESHNYADGGEVADEEPTGWQRVQERLSAAGPEPEEPTGFSRMQERFADPEPAAGPMAGVSGDWSPAESSGVPAAPAAGGEFASAPAAPSGAAPQNLSSGSMADYEKAYRKVGAGLSQGAKAEGDLGKAEAAQLQSSTDKLQALGDSQAAKFKDLDAERVKLQNDVVNGHIDPNKYLGSMDTGKKISTAIGLILGGIGGGLTHQGNSAMTFLQNQIDNDIKAQQADLGKKQTLLSANMQQFGNLKDATAMTRANMMDITSLKLKQMAAEAQDPIAKNRALVQAGLLDVQAAKETAPMKFKQELLKKAAQQGSNFDPAELVPALVPQHAQAKVNAEIAQAQAANATGGQIDKLFKQAQKENTLFGRGTRLGFEPPAIKALHAAYLPMIKDDVGRVSEFEHDALKALDPTPGSRDSTNEEKLQALKAFINHKKEAPTAKGFGIDVNKFSSTTSDPFVRLAPEQKQYANWAKQNPNDPRAQVVLKKLGLR